MVEITGEVDHKERSQMMRPEVVKPDPKEFSNIPVFHLRIFTAAGKLVQVLYKAEPPGDADTGEGSRSSLRGLPKFTNAVLSTHQVFTMPRQIVGNKASLVSQSDHLCLS